MFSKWNNAYIKISKSIIEKILKNKGIKYDKNNIKLEVRKYIRVYDPYTDTIIPFNDPKNYLKFREHTITDRHIYLLPCNSLINERLQSRATEMETPLLKSHKYRVSFNYSNISIYIKYIQRRVYKEKVELNSSESHVHFLVHGLYLRTRKKVTFNDVAMVINSLPIYKIEFLLLQE